MRFLAIICALSVASPQIQFVDMAERAGLKDVFVCGDDKSKRYIVETLGTGIALVDYDNDGYPDVFAVTASRLEGYPKGQEPQNHLYRNNHDGTFTDVTHQSGLGRSGWGQGVCAGDFDNDGYVDLYVTYWGHDVLYRNTGKGKFEDVTESAGLGTSEVRWGSGCAFVDYNRRRQARSVRRELSSVRHQEYSHSRQSRRVQMERAVRHVRSTRAEGRIKSSVSE